MRPLPELIAGKAVEALYGYQTNAPRDGGRLVNPVLFGELLTGARGLNAAPDEELLKERRQQFFQLARVATNLNQLVVLVRSVPVVELQVRATIDQVQQVLAKIHQTLPGT